MNAGEKYLLLLFCFFAYNVLGQDWQLVDYPVIIDDKELLNPWVGGLSNPQMSKADIDFDGTDELIVFDRMSEKVYVFSHIEGNKYRYMPDLGRNFPEMVNFCLLKDYNKDGIPDIFTYSHPDPVSGIRVFKGYVNSEGKLAFEPIVHNQNNFPNVLHYKIRNSVSNIYLAYTDLPAIADVDGDGDLDILAFDVAGAQLIYYRNVSVEDYGHADSLEYILEDNCWGKFLEGVSFDDVFLSDDINSCAEYPDGGKVRSRHAGSNTELIDYNKDGLWDLLISDVDITNVALFLNGGTKQKAWITDVIADFPANDPVRIELFPVVTSLDIDNDTKNDLIFSPGATSVLRDDIEVAHFYSNVGNEEQDSFILIQKDFLTNEMLDFGTGSIPAITDVNGDGLWDIVVGMYSSYIPGQLGGRLVLLQNVGNIEQPKFVLISSDWLNLNRRYPNIYGFAPVFGDLDNDGDQDLILGTADGKILFFENVAGQGKPMSFKEAEQWNFGIRSGSNPVPQLIDINRDGLNDLLIGEGQGFITLYRNIGTKESPLFDNDPDNSVNQRFFSNIDVRTGPGFGYAAPYIIDSGTGRLMIAGRSERGFKVFLENENADYQEIPHFLNDWNEGVRTAVAAADFTNSGYLDLVTGNWNGGLSIYSTGIPSSGNGQSGNSLFDVVIIPNPADQYIRITSQVPSWHSGFSYKITSVAGAVIIAEDTAEWGQRIDTKHLVPGVYVIHVSVGALAVQKKIVIVR